MHSVSPVLVEYQRKEEQMQPISALPPGEQLARLEQMYSKPSISSKETTLQLAQAVITKEASALDNLVNTLDISFVMATQVILSSTGRVIFMGVGKSGLIGRKLAASFASLGTPALFVHAVEAAHGDLGMITSRDVVLIISHSGETDELVNLLPALMRFRCPLIAITGRPYSRLARAASVHLDTGVREEADPRGLAPTTSATVTLVMGNALALVLAEARHFTPDAFHELHPGGSSGRQKIINSQVNDVKKR